MSPSTLRGRNSQGAWKLTVQDLGPADKGTLNSWVLDIGSAATTTGPVELKESPGARIPDYPAAGIERSLANGKAFAIGSGEVSLDISHTFIGNLQVSLVSPQGTAIVLHDGAGGSTRDHIQVFAAISLNEAGHHIPVKITAVSGFSSDANDDWATQHLAPGCVVLSDGLACFRSATTASCSHQVVVTGVKQPNDLAQFR